MLMGDGLGAHQDGEWRVLVRGQHLPGKVLPEAARLPACPEQVVAGLPVPPQGQRHQ
jgi:hypothetical protein